MMKMDFNGKEYEFYSPGDKVWFLEGSGVNVKVIAEVRLECKDEKPVPKYMYSTNSGGFEHREPLPKDLYPSKSECIVDKMFSTDDGLREIYDVVGKRIDGRENGTREQLPEAKERKSRAARFIEGIFGSRENKDNGKDNGIQDI